MAYAFDVIGYFEYYRRHTCYIVLAWKDIQDILIEHGIINEDEFNKINQLVIWHDNSKIDKEEFDAYGAKFYPVKSENSETDLENINAAFKIAWNHHKANNLHHHQRLKDYKGDDWKCYIIEMALDWIAMGWETGTSAYEYYENNKDHIDLPIEYKSFLEEVLNLIKSNMCYANANLSAENEAKLYFK